MGSQGLSVKMSATIGLETLKFQLLQGFRTGNLILDTMVAGLIISCSGFIFEHLRCLVNIPWSLSCLLDFILGRKVHEITIRGQKIQTGAATRNEFSQKFRAVLHQVKKLDFVEADINKIEEVESSGGCISLVRQRHPFKFTPDIFGRMEVHTDESKSETPMKTEKYTVRVFSSTQGLDELDKLVAQWEKDYSDFMNANTRNSITITGRKVTDLRFRVVEFSDKFHAVLHQISKLSCLESDVKHLSEVHFDLDDPFKPSVDKKKQSGLVVLQDKPFKLTEAVFGIFTMKKEIDKSEVPSETYTIKLFSDVLTVDQLTALLDSWVGQWEERVNSGDGLKYFNYNGFSKKELERMSIDDRFKPHAFTEFAFDSSKTFENLFFSQKAQVIERLKFFMENEAWYRERGLPYTLGFLFHGEPGCGKTSTIKAIANMTKRHIVSVPLKNICTTEDLMKVFHGVKINERKIPVKRRLYVLEDIDCADLEETVSRRDEKDKVVQEAKRPDGIVTMAEEPPKNRLTLASLLEVFDGVMEMPGRMMVITTNHPEKLDKALIRPGRIDLNLEFGKCTSRDVGDIYRNFYNKEVDLEVEREITDGVWTPAEVMQIFLNNFSQPERGLKEAKTKHCS